MRARAQREMSTTPQLPQNVPEDAGFIYDKTAVFDMAMKRNTLYVVRSVTRNTGTKVTNFNLLLAARQ